MPDGGLPFARPLGEPHGSAPFFADADPTSSSLLITTAVVAMAHRVARHDAAVAQHPWLERATSFCLTAAEAIGPKSHALEVRGALDLLDALVEDRPGVAPLIDHVGAAIPASGAMHVEGGLEDELMRPLDFAPLPDRPGRALFSDHLVQADLDRLAGLQSGDGGWPVEFLTYSPMSTLEWRGHLTVRALWILDANGRRVRG